MRGGLIVLLVATPSLAAADPFDHIDSIHGAASLEYEASWVEAYDRASVMTAPDGLGLAGARLRGQIGGRWLEYRIGLDLHAGATAPGGFAYDVDLYPIGVGTRLGTWSRFGIVAGVGASGATGTVDDAAQFPVEACLELGLGGHLRAIARGRLSWLAGADGRVRGVRTLPFGDELDASVALRVGHRWTDYGFPSGNGYYLGVAYRESQGVRMVGLVLGHSIDVGSR